MTVGAIIGRRAYLDQGKSCGRRPPAATLLAQGAGGKESPGDWDGLGGGAHVYGCKRGWRSLPNDGPPDIGGILIAEANSQAVTARSVCATPHWFVLCCFWMQLGGDTSRGLNPTDVSAWDGAPGGTPTHTFTIYIRLYKTGSFWEEDHNS